MTLLGESTFLSLMSDFTVSTIAFGALHERAALHWLSLLPLFVGSDMIQNLGKIFLERDLILASLFY